MRAGKGGTGCGCCAFWEKTWDREDEGYQSEGICRRRAPHALPSIEMGEDGAEDAWPSFKGVYTSWPRTFCDSDWCGDYVTREDLTGRYAREEPEVPVFARVRIGELEEQLREARVRLHKLQKARESKT